MKQLLIYSTEEVTQEMLYGMDLHQEIIINGDHRGYTKNVTRVLGGWLYTTHAYGTIDTTFVPFNFKDHA